MTHQLLLIAHIATLGYWLGAELAINATYRFVCYRDDLPFVARDAVMAHIMSADQHVRYALILQLTLGAMLMAATGLLQASLWPIATAGALWLGFVELVHRWRERSAGPLLAAIDRWSRYVLISVLAGIALSAPLPLWLRAKLALFAGVMLCGVGIRLALIRHFRIWQHMAAYGATVDRNAAIKAIYAHATDILALLWLMIGGITLLAIVKP